MFYNRDQWAKALPKVIVVYVGLILLWAALWFTIGDATWWLTLLHRLVPYLFLPVPLLLVLIVRREHKRLAYWLVVPTAIFGLLYHPYLIPKKAASELTPHLSVMTYNVLFTNDDYDAVANVILSYQPDLVALQEVQPEMMDSLRERLGQDYPFSVMGSEEAYGTTALFSQHPIVDSYVLDLEVDRPATVIKTEIDNREFTFIAAHLLPYGLWRTYWLDWPRVAMAQTVAQNRQAQIILEQIEKAEKADGIAIVGCDCNSKETSTTMRMLAHVLKNTARQVGWRVGGSGLADAKADRDFQHIDYIFYRGELTPLEIYTLRDSGGSDHLPVLAIYSFQ